MTTELAPEITYTPPKLAPVEGEKEKIETPKMYMIVLLNDDTTSPFFVEDVLEAVCGLNRREATRKMMEAHQSGSAKIRAYTKEVADMKMAQLHAIIAERGINTRFPDQPCELKFACEPE